jgi:hypothetical protein
MARVHSQGKATEQFPACVDAARPAYGVAPVIYPTSPRSGPPFRLCRATPAVMAGIASANSRLHAPNENAALQDCFRGICFEGELISCIAIGRQSG